MNLLVIDGKCLSARLAFRGRVAETIQYLHGFGASLGREYARNPWNVLSTRGNGGPREGVTDPPAFDRFACDVNVERQK